MANINNNEQQLLIAVSQAEGIAECGHLDVAEQYLEDERNRFVVAYMSRNEDFAKSSAWRKAENVAGKFLQELHR